MKLQHLQEARHIGNSKHIAWVFDQLELVKNRLDQGEDWKIRIQPNEYENIRRQLIHALGEPETIPHARGSKTDYWYKWWEDEYGNNGAQVSLEYFNSPKMLPSLSVIDY